jgi:23S rRNA (uracil1939-C5)-methyltransferase
VADAILTLDVEKPAAGGRMLARHNGQVVLVWGAIPGERVRARVERTGKGLLYADTVEVLTVSADRREVIADWRCGGNVLAHINYPRQLRLKSDIIRDAFARIARMPLTDAPDIIGSPEQGYRMRARLHVRGTRIGFMREGSHELCEVGPTAQMLPETVAWIDSAQECLQRDRLTGLASIEIAENIPGSERACTSSSSRAPTPRRLPRSPVMGWASLHRSSIVETVEQLAGIPSVSDVLLAKPDDESSGLRLQRDARAFFQGNRFLLERLVRHVATLVPAGPIVDLYAGVGLFGLSLGCGRRRGRHRRGGDPISGRDLDENARRFAERVRVEHSSVEDFVVRRSPDHDATFIVDPPRTGISKEALGGIVRLMPKRIIYVSCDVATLARDSRALVNAGYSLGELSGIDLFPNTAHVETVCTFHHL